MNQISWEQLQANCSQLAEKLSIAVDDTQNVVLVGIARGGWIPARLVAEKLGISRLYSAGTSYTDGGRTELDAYQQPNVSNSSVILIEDVTESGKSLQLVKRLMEAQNNKVRTAALYTTDETVIEPDFYLERLNAVPTMPWEI